MLTQEEFFKIKEEKGCVVFHLINIANDGEEVHYYSVSDDYEKYVKELKHFKGE